MNPLKSILLHLDNSANLAHRVRVARQLAEAFDARVSALYCTTPATLRYPQPLDGAGMAAALMAQVDDEALARARREFASACSGEPRLNWVDSTVNAPWDFGRRAMYSDLVVLGQRDPEGAEADQLPADFVPDVLAGSGRPALVWPYAEPARSVGRVVLVAWKETGECARAVSAAIPWLSRADHVHAVCYADESDAPLRGLAAWLTTHGVTVTLHPGGRKPGPVGDRLLSLAADLGADLLVMGCYGHSRAREWVLGGATRSILASMTLPVLMMH
jgi:nucleotide-binding universal stress UspA family protein